MYIGITEAGDAGRDLSWYPQAYYDNNLKGVVLITKSGQLKEFQRRALELNKVKPVIIHFTITGWGMYAMEPNVAAPIIVLRSIRSLIDSGFPAERCVLRVDPIIPTEQGLSLAADVLRHYQDIIPDVSRIRVSIYDDYHKAREKMVLRGYPPVDNMLKWKNEAERRPSRDQVRAVADILTTVLPNQVYECCAEPELVEYVPSRFKAIGCVSKRDCDIMGIAVPIDVGENGQNRFGCKCLRIKRELLSHKHPCVNDCAYCYWS